MSAPDCAAMTAFLFRHSAGSARDTTRARQACQAGPARLPGLAKPARAAPPRPPATRHRAPGIHPGGSRAAARRPAGGRSRNVADGAPDRPAGADGSGPRGRGVACRTGDDESGFRPGAATATWRRRVASGARPARGGAVGGRASVAHRGAAPRRPRLPPARQAGLRIAPAPGLPAIDNDYQDLQHARRPPGQATDIFQANTLSLRLTYLHKPLSAPLRALLVALARGAQTPPARQGAAFTPGLAADDARGYAGQALARGLLPIVVELDMEMHSHPADWSRLRPWPEGMVSGACRRLRCG